MLFLKAYPKRVQPVAVLLLRLVWPDNPGFLTTAHDTAQSFA